MVASHDLSTTTGMTRSQIPDSLERQIPDDEAQRVIFWGWKGSDAGLQW